MKKIIGMMLWATLCARSTQCVINEFDVPEEMKQHIESFLGCMMGKEDTILLEKRVLQQCDTQTCSRFRTTQFFAAFFEKEAFLSGYYVVRKNGKGEKCFSFDPKVMIAYAPNIENIALFEPTKGFRIFDMYSQKVIYELQPKEINVPEGFVLDDVRAFATTADGKKIALLFKDYRTNYVITLVDLETKEVVKTYKNEGTIRRYVLDPEKIVPSIWVTWYLSFNLDGTMLGIGEGVPSHGYGLQFFFSEIATGFTAAKVFEEPLTIDRCLQYKEAWKAFKNLKLT